ncbi:GRX1 [Candida oxycetoniae]|uniref:GRX1 n=1 Tax=Candida oxycetoniae TaxID=497107 RepID=A0AAI9WYT4_9ASCO|nr:GRX1 [Candida oxycetoniae]KAI3405379.1 GRX1 [Candida oxycetoniae]
MLRLVSRSFSPYITTRIPITRKISSSNMYAAQSKIKVQKLIKEKPILIFSKTFCPYCTQTKHTIEGITKDAYILELDDLGDGQDIQETLAELTGQNTVPSVFIGGEHIGGNSDVQTLNEQGKLAEKIRAVS